LKGLEVEDENCGGREKDDEFGGDLSEKGGRDQA